MSSISGTGSPLAISTSIKLEAAVAAAPASPTGTSGAFYTQLSFPTADVAGSVLNSLNSPDGGEAAIFATLLDQAKTNSDAATAAIQAHASRLQTLNGIMRAASTQIQNLISTNASKAQQLAAEQAKLQKDTAALAAAKQANDQNGIDQANAAIVDDNKQITDLSNTISANTTEISSLQSAQLTAANQLSLTAETLHKALQNNTIDDQLISAQTAQVLDDITKFAAQLQTQGLQGVSQAFFEKYLKEDKTKRLVEVTKQLSLALSAAYVPAAAPQPASTLSNDPTQSGNSSRVKLPL